MLQPGAELCRLKYFASTVGLRGASGEFDRQELWLKAANTMPNVSIIAGLHLGPDCSAARRKEKQTDVIIAIDLLLKALDPQ